MTELLTTGQRERAYKRLLKILAQRDLPRPKAVQKLTKHVKVKKQDGELIEKNPIYKYSNDASDFLKDVVNSEEHPIEVDKGKITRTDLNGETA